MKMLSVNKSNLVKKVLANFYVQWNTEVTVLELNARLVCLVASSCYSNKSREFEREKSCDFFLFDY